MNLRVPLAFCATSAPPRCFFGMNGGFLRSATLLPLLFHSYTLSLLHSSPHSGCYRPSFLSQHSPNPRLVSLSPSAKILNVATRGRVAQLGERVVRNDEVAGSNPVTSTIPSSFRQLPQLPYFSCCKIPRKLSPSLPLMFVWVTRLYPKITWLQHPRNLGQATLDPG